ncbi:MULTISPECIES: hypothetical protein [Streptomyces]|uniref:Secreted protein n=1 Tax=Streptomyces albus (strain ATCC 21838 / DSM 41398 / FERM P-419 / JCM 4703 / NBRC 107858) TaxID=1081613 RepID=A0A0B5F0S4_STRA4|nr:hypothetical protein [Streptomyces sp. SCSIO ZS0520]AJE83907.1 secreted protein [Streptomyces albus]AOU78211.1 secreted protein [Streptomyces albus]AYN33964.1 hypothetical protein DUI70_3463 [Streptomyces albus]
MLTRIATAVGAALVAAVALTVPAAADNADSAPARATTTRSADAATTAQAAKSAPQADARKAAAWGYVIDGSCGGREGQIRGGANYWGGATEGSGTPVNCVSGYVEGCGARGSEPVYQAGGVIGCNWGAGQKITLSTLASDFQLLAAHEFGHNWYGHSGYACMSWNSPDEVMAPTMCG